MLESRAIRFLLVVGLINGLVCTVAPSIVLLRAGGAEEPIGHLVFVLAVVAVALTPLQAAALWVVVSPRVRTLLAFRTTRRLVEQILREESIDTAFQPIIDVQLGRVVGAEALSRFTTGPARSPDLWFAAAESVGRGLDLEEVTLRKALTRSFGLPYGCYVAVNASPCMLTSSRLLPLLKASGFPLDRIVVEITEHTSIPDYTPALAAREQLRAHGIRLAVDDAGAGYASLQHILALAPDMIKIDRSLISGVEADSVRGSMVAAVVMFALQSGAALVAEGVENAAELDALRILGVDHAQGYLIARPSTDPADWATWRAPAAQSRKHSSGGAVVGTSTATTAPKMLLPRPVATPLPAGH
jgi:EAL domain-containing protein (putative c-di-GMP-specific phosphodiesterase class I)